MRKALSSTLFALLTGIFGCDTPRSPIAPDQPAMSQSDTIDVSAQEAQAPQAELVATPNGWYHRSCVHEIPNGATEHRDGTITTQGGASLRLPQCKYPGKRSADGRRFTRSTSLGHKRQPPENDGWIEYTWYQLSGHTYSELSAEWVIPDDPSSSYSGSTGPYYTFPGLMSAEYILQPVLQYGNNGHYGGNYWTLTAWRCNDGTNCTYSTPLTASVGDTIQGVVDSSNCGGGECVWTVVTRNLTTDTLTYRSWVDTVGFYIATGGTVEVYDINYCSEYPRYGVSFTNILLKNESGTTVTPDWSEIVTGGLNPSCSFSVNSTATTVDFTHFAPLSVGISGDDQIAPDEECGWQALGGGGIPPHSYNWWGALSGSNQTIYGELGQSSWLWVAIIDSRSVADTAQFFISVDDAYACDWK